MPGTPISTKNYTYGNATWGDLLTGYNGKTITYDAIGNPRNDGTWQYTWVQGRQLVKMEKTGTTWNFTYDADGLRTSRSNGTTAYNYVYSDGVLRQMTCGTNKLVFAYGVDGRPYALQYNGTYYYYLLNLQGDVIGIANTSGTQVVSYTYDAWGDILSVTGSMASTLGQLNPLRYRGYVYDSETGLYYLKSRYYNAEIGRFISPDNYPSTGQDFTGNNMFAYCGNNPVSREDESGEFWGTAVLISAFVAGVISAAADALVQVATTGTVDIEQTLIAGASGAVSGACALIPGGAFATTAISMGINAALSAGSYAVNQLRKGESIDPTDMWVNAGIGAASGAVGNLFRINSTGALRNTGTKLIDKGMQKMTNGVLNSATSTVERGFQYIDRGISVIYQYASRAGVNSGLGSATGSFAGGVYSLFG